MHSRRCPHVQARFQQRLNIASVTSRRSPIMRSAPTRSQLREAQRKKVPYHFLGGDFARNQSVLEHSDLYRRRAQENITRYGSSRAPPQQPSPFLNLPVEVSSGICNSLDITERGDFDALAALAQTRRPMKNIVTDRTRRRTRFMSTIHFSHDFFEGCTTGRPSIMPGNWCSIQKGIRDTLWSRLSPT